VRAIWKGAISFGMVSIPVKLYTATEQKDVRFRLLHKKDGAPIVEKRFCTLEDKEVAWEDLARGFEVSKGEFVVLDPEEIEAVEPESASTIEIGDFVELEEIDPIYFEKSYYLGPDKGGEKAYRLLADAMAKADRVALATFVMRGKESLVLIRPADKGLMLHTMYFADEVRDFGEVEKGEGAKIREGELELAEKLIAELTHDEFKPEQYKDEYRQRVLDLVNTKVEGKEITTAAAPAERAQVIDLMDALKQSLAKRASSPAAPESERKPPVKLVKRVAEATAKPERKAQAGKK
jgi:DNA end-binding protein Ku